MASTGPPPRAWVSRAERRKLYCRLSCRLEFSHNSVPRKLQNEDAILRKIADSSRPSSGREAAKSVLLGIGDDAALFRPKPGHELILTCDWFLEGTHFLREKHHPDSAGWKCLARALSDVAAMGGIPRCFLLSLALPETHTGQWLDLFLGGLRRASRRFRCLLAGGDTTRHHDILIDVTVVGEVRTGSAILRSGTSQKFRRWESRASPFGATMTPCSSRCTAAMTTNCCLPCRRVKRNSFRRLFEARVSPQLEKSPRAASYCC